MSKRIVAVVPVRKGSQRVKSKNTKNFADTSLLALKLKVLKSVEGLADIIVSTDCDIAVDIAQKNGVSVHRREEYFASSVVTNDQHWKHIAESTPADVIMMAQTTSPMVRVATYQQALDQFVNSSRDEIDSINSVTPEKKFLWLNGAPLNYDINKTPKSQDLPDIVSLNFAITIIERDLMIERMNVVGNKPRFITLDRLESVDVDDELDFDFAEYLYKRLGYEWIANGA